MSVGGPALLQRDLQRVSVIPWLRQGIVAQLDEAIDLLPLDASRFLEPDSEHPFGRLVVEDHRARRIHEDDWHGQVAAQLPREDHLHRLLGHRSLRRRGTNHVRGIVLLNTRSPWSQRSPPWEGRRAIRGEPVDRRPVLIEAVGVFERPKGSGIFWIRYHIHGRGISREGRWEGGCHRPLPAAQNPGAGRDPPPAPNGGQSAYRVRI